MEKKEKWYISFIKWIGSAIEDKRGAISWKRILAIYGMKIFADYVQNTSATWDKMALVASVPLLFMGMTIPEWFSKGPLINGAQIGKE